MQKKGDLVTFTFGGVRRRGVIFEDVFSHEVPTPTHGKYEFVGQLIKWENGEKTVRLGYYGGKSKSMIRNAPCMEREDFVKFIKEGMKKDWFKELLEKGIIEE